MIIDEKTLYHNLKSNQSGDFLKFKEGNNRLIIKSKGGSVLTHFYNKQLVACIKTACELCKAKNKKRQEIFYFVSLNGQEGLIRLPLSVFIACQNIINSGIYQIDNIREAEWLVVKKGEGRETKYTVSFINKIEPKEDEIQKNTDRLEKFISKYQARLNERYDKIFPVELEEEMKEDINPDDLPI